MAESLLKVMRRHLPALLFVLSALCASAQHVVSGVVVDSELETPLPFVAVMANDNPGLAVLSDIDGKFEIRSTEAVNQLELRYVGYETQTFRVRASKTDLHIALVRKATQIGEVEIIAGENPAHRIIKQAIQNKKQNDPHRLTSFKYRSYNKFYVTAEVDSMKFDGESMTISVGTGPPPVDTLGQVDSAVVDSNADRARAFLNNHHLFLMESVTERAFKRPDRSYEKVIANRVSGLKNPTFFLLATQLQSFDFYHDHFTLLGKNYLSPLSRGSTRQYFFNIEDTTWAGSDTVFIISYKPLTGKNFDALAGLLYINTSTYAIQSVIAEPVHESKTRVTIQQNYARIDGVEWFPVQLNTDFTFENAVANGAGLKAIGRTYLDDVQIEPKLRGRDFGAVSVELDKAATVRNHEAFKQYRTNSLSAKDSNTYSFIDSLGEAENIDLMISGMRTLLEGKVRFGAINWDWTKLLGYNTKRGWRLGLALETNERLSRVLKLRGNGSYSFGAKAWQYGGDIKLNLSHRHELSVSAGYKKHFDPAGTTTFHKDHFIGLDRWLLRIIAPDVVSSSSWRAALGFRALKYLLVEIRGESGQNSVDGDYLFLQDFDDVQVGKRVFSHTTIAARLRYAFRERVVQTPTETFSLGTHYPVLWLNIERSLPNVLNGELDYWRFTAKVSKSLVLKRLGKTTMSATGGYLMGDAPYWRNFIPTGSQGRFSILWVQDAFNAMRTNEFITDRFISARISHNFRQMIFGKGKKSPDLRLTTSATFGEFKQADAHRHLEFKIPTQGYYESGVVLEKLVRFKYFNLASIGWGLALFYRYGPYTVDPWWKNAAVRLSLSAGL